MCFVVIIVQFWLYFDNIICNMAKVKNKELNFDYLNGMVGLPFEGFKFLGIRILSMLVWRNVRRSRESNSLIITVSSTKSNAQT